MTAEATLLDNSKALKVWLSERQGHWKEIRQGRQADKEGTEDGMWGLD